MASVTGAKQPIKVPKREWKEDDDGMVGERDSNIVDILSRLQMLVRGIHSGNEEQPSSGSNRPSLDTIFSR